LRVVINLQRLSFSMVFSNPVNNVDIHCRPSTPQDAASAIPKREVRCSGRETCCSSWRIFTSGGTGRVVVQHTQVAFADPQRRYRILQQAHAATGLTLVAFAVQELERRARVEEQHATAPSELGLARHQGLGMYIVPLVGRDDEHVLMECARADASQTV
jgi:hypothetical protein